MDDHRNWCQPLRVRYDDRQGLFYLLSSDSKRRGYLPKGFDMAYLVPAETEAKVRRAVERRVQTLPVNGTSGD